MLHPKETNRLARMERFDNKTGEKHCWAQLAYLGMMKHEAGEELEDQKDMARSGETCKGHSLENGSCWCNKFIDGELQQKPVGGMK